MSMLQVKFDFRLSLILRRLILSFLCLPTLGDKGNNWPRLSNFKLKSNLTCNIYTDMVDRERARAWDKEEQRSFHWMENGAVKKSGQEHIQHFLNKSCIIFLEVSHCRRVAQHSGNKLKDVYKKVCCMYKVVFLLVILNLLIFYAVLIIVAIYH